MDDIQRSVILSATVGGAVIATAVRLTQSLVGRLRGRPFVHATGWRAAAWWTLGFGGLALSIIGVLSIGVIVLPFAVAACGFAAWRQRAIPEAAIGAALGSGALSLFIGLTNLGYKPCGAGPVTIHGNGFYSCGGVNGAPWLPLAILLLVIGIISEAILVRTSRTASAAQ